jgi:hypothetical protein
VPSSPVHRMALPIILQSSICRGFELRGTSLAETSSSLSRGKVSLSIVQPL